MVEQEMRNNEEDHHRSFREVYTSYRDAGVPAIMPTVDFLIKEDVPEMVGGEGSPNGF